MSNQEFFRTEVKSLETLTKRVSNLKEDLKHARLQFERKGTNEQEQQKVRYCHIVNDMLAKAVYEVIKFRGAMTA